MSTSVTAVQQMHHSHAARILEAMKRPRVQEIEKEWIELLAEEVV